MFLTSLVKKKKKKKKKKSSRVVVASSICAAHKLLFPTHKLQGAPPSPLSLLNMGFPHDQPPRKLRVLCLHGFRTSASIFEKQVRRWNSSVLELLDLTFLDGPFPCGGKSDVEGIFPPPYYEWFQFNIIFTEFTGLDECIEYISNFMDEHGPFDGLMGFSQGAVLTAALAGLQQKKLALTRHPPLRFVVVISGAMFKNQKIKEDCYSEQIKCPSVHLIGANDWLKPKNEEVREVFGNPLIIRHEAKHIVPRLDEQAANTLKDFLSRFLQEVSVEPGSANPETRDESLHEIEVAA